MVIDVPGKSIDEIVDLFVKNFEQTYENCVYGGTLTGEDESRALFYAIAEDIVREDPIRYNQIVQRKLLERLVERKREALGSLVDDVEEMFMLNSEKLLGDLLG